MDDILRIAEVLYGGLCRQIGTPTEVAIRRDIKDMEEMIMKSFYNKRGCVLINSGSYREGFRFSSSDMDTMLWWCKYKLITDISQAEVYSSSKHNIILIEDSDTPPGFVRLELLTSTRNDFVISCLASFNGRYYISSSLWTERHFQIFSKVKRNQTQNFTIHGPCTSGFYGPIKFDHAICFSTLFWPKTFNVWIDRCLRYIWPSAPVMEKILRNGCHCVPIGSKIVSTSNELEWRLSFSQAEQQLVYNMNHTQFLCYGLLKIFSKEVINHREEPLLCSYYMKTTMFWMIQLGHLRWCPNNLLNCFWKCFKYLIHCVYRGVFPNFFVPQNNMFKNKVVGDARESLLQQLYQYYRMGVSCLLLSPTLRPILELALSSPFVVLSSDVGEMIDISTTDMCCKTGKYDKTFHITVLTKQRMSQSVNMYRDTTDRLGNKYQCLQSLKDLQKLLLYDDGTYVPLKFRDISWQILGICQHMLYQYYRMGVSCLQLSPTLRSILEAALGDTSFVLSSVEGEFIATADIDLCGSYEILFVVKKVTVGVSKSCKEPNCRNCAVRASIKEKSCRSRYSKSQAVRAGNHKSRAIHFSKKCLKTDAVPSVFPWIQNAPPRKPPRERHHLPPSRKILRELPSNLVDQLERTEPENHEIDSTDTHS
ncbi:uncharacterized protein LOC133174632 [Saccostrea echinata]|uniref:uncharacterized protein LOC133174632 n=1 Tax=Saccostrea echinata TaxID=191078 RepID=UPI002A7EA630|nr:uncharacterized protein LOC133174632 [Saccostrea echinata]